MNGDFKIFTKTIDVIYLLDYISNTGIKTLVRHFIKFINGKENVIFNIFV